MIKDLPSQKSIWNDNINLRREEFKKIIKSADRTALCSLLKTLHERRIILEQCGKSLSVYDERFLKQAQNIIHGEIALVLELNPEEVEPFITKTIEAA